MASFGHPPLQSQQQQQQQQQQPSFVPAAMAAATQQVQMHLPMAASQPPGTFAPGTKIQVGGLRVVIQKYLSEGGFAHVYLVKMPQPVHGTDMAVLKRVAVPDKDTLRGMRTEVETMKRLKGHKPIVTYIDSHASEMQGGGYEVFLLMEFCNGGGLIDFMNTRLQHRLTEPEILKIFTDVAEGVACMHYLKPALLHRDLKVENVLITNSPDGSKRFKVCDFGSAAPPRPAATTIAECRQIDDDIQRHTTLQYRSPEMVDVYRKLPIDEKSDIWALGVLLYKLCYYTTPFEDQGQLAILNATLRFPSYPVFSDRLRNLIAAMLREAPSNRPNIYQVLKEGCRMQGREIPIHDIYSTKPSDASVQSAPAEPKSTVGVTISHQAPVQQKLPDIVPMRRGRPTSTTPAGISGLASPSPSASTKPSSSPLRVISGDPFAALDSSKGSATPPTTTKISTPAQVLSPPPASMEPTDELSARFPTLDQFSLLHDHGGKFDFDSLASPHEFNRITSEKFTDDAFSIPPSKSTTPAGASAGPKPASNSAGAMSKAQAIISSNPELQAISSQGASSYKPSLISTTMTNVDISPVIRPQIHRYPASSETNPMRQSADDIRPIGAAKTATISNPATRNTSARPSMESSRPHIDLLDVSPPNRATTIGASGCGSRSRPVSTHLESNMDFLREKERERASLDKGSRRSLDRSSRKSIEKSRTSTDLGGDDLEYLRQSEEAEAKKSKHGKRSSFSLSSGKNILSGKFGDAFKRFESHHGSGSSSSQAPARTPSPMKDVHDQILTPIAGSEATDGRTDDGHDPENEDDMTPEMRREFERLQLAEEERRVEAAQAEYRRRITERESGSSSSGGPISTPASIGGVSRAISIQNRVQSLLSEEQRTAPVQRTAQGYGRFTDTSVPGNSPAAPPSPNKPEIPRKPIRVKTSETQLNTKLDMPTGGSLVSNRPTVPSKPVAPKKPGHLNGTPTGRAPSPTKGLAPAQPITPSGGGAGNSDLLSDFSKRFPSLNALEMVDMDLDKK